jgi:Holliday junction DNA helicase RuvB
MTDRPISPTATREDDAIEASIRPRKLDEYLGQQAVREQLARSTSKRPSAAARRWIMC